jgi:hypothetical protein
MLKSYKIKTHTIFYTTFLGPKNKGLERKINSDRNFFVEKIGTHTNFFWTFFDHIRTFFGPL